MVTEWAASLGTVRGGSDAGRWVKASPGISVWMEDGEKRDDKKWWEEQ